MVDEGDFGAETTTGELPMVASGQLQPTSREPCLVILAGPRIGETVPIGDDALTIGRGPDVQLRVEDPALSKRHLQLRKSPDGTVVVEDLSSSNGTFVNGERVERRVLADGDKLVLGNTTFKFVLADQLERSFQTQLYDAALRDPLTQLYNRRHLMAQLDAELSFAARHESPLSLVLMDIDHFKRVNDTHGHAVGDEVLRTLSRVISKCIRKEDMAARYGGEELALVCRGTVPEMTVVVAERIRARIENARLIDTMPDLKLTISAGIAGVPDPMIRNRAALIGSADRALYRAKHEGRNRVCLYGGDTD